MDNIPKTTCKISEETMASLEGVFFSWNPEDMQLLHGKNFTVMELQHYSVKLALQTDYFSAWKCLHNVFAPTSSMFLLPR